MNLNHCLNWFTNCRSIYLCECECEKCKMEKYETVNHPKHYNSHPSGIECIDLAECFSGNIFVAIKHLWRVGLKPGVDFSEDLKKSRFYLEREVNRLKPWNQFGFSLSHYKARFDSMFDGDITLMCDKIIQSEPKSPLAYVLTALIKNKNPLEALDLWIHEQTFTVK